MNANIQAERIDKALQVIERMKEGIDITQACHFMGMHQSTFEKVCEENPEIFDKLREVVVIIGQRVKELQTAEINELKQELEADGIMDRADILSLLQR
jgi:hypothetical protein